jgi:hypothetical protein
MGGMPLAISSKRTIGSGFQELMQQRLAAGIRSVCRVSDQLAESA